MTWVLNSSVTSAQREGISKFVDEQFDLAFNLTQEAGDLSHVRWGRIDYMNVTAITTKWAVWRYVSQYQFHHIEMHFNMMSKGRRIL